MKTFIHLFVVSSLNPATTTERRSRLSDRLFIISIKVYASFELGPRLGNGELLTEFKILVGEVLDVTQ